MTRALAILCVLSVFFVAAFGEKAFSAETHTALMAHDAWAPPSLDGANVGVAFTMLMNHSDVPIEITALSSPVAKTVELHDHVSEGGKVKMRRVEKIVIPAQGTLNMKPGGLHLMLIGLTQPLKDDSTITIDITAKGSAVQKVSFTVSQARLIEALKSRSNSAHEH